MATNNAATVEAAVYERVEVMRLQRALGHSGPADDNVTKVLLETVRTGAVIADYAIHSARRRPGSEPVVAFGYLMHLLWDRGDDVRGTSSRTLGYLDRALVTLSAFASEFGGRATENEKFVGFSAMPRRAPGRTSDAVRLVDLGNRIRERTGYQPVVHASKAQRPWAAVENLNATVDAPFDFDPFLGLVSIRALTTGASAVEESMESLRGAAELSAAASDWNFRRGDVPLASFESLRSSDSSGFALEALESRSQPDPIHDEGALFPVWYGTDRGPLRGDPAIGFSNRRDPDGGVYLGRCWVNIPRGHKFGSTGRNWWQKLLKQDKHQRLQISAIQPSGGRKEFAKSIDDALAKLDNDDRTALLYVHGYSTTFREAAIRCAQMGFDLKVEGISAFFSWPSAGRTMSYTRDVNAIESSEQNFVNFVTTLASKTDLTKINLIVHSMGNRLVARSIARIEHRLSKKNVKLGVIVLAAPDIDTILFKQLASTYPKISANTTMYVSRADKALALSKLTWRADRAGFTPPVTVTSGVHTIEVSDVDVSRIGHGYYAAAQPVLYDIRELLDGKYDPAKRLRLQEVASLAQPYWRFSP